LKLFIYIFLTFSLLFSNTKIEGTGKSFYFDNLIYFFNSDSKTETEQKIEDLDFNDEFEEFEEIEEKSDPFEEYNIIMTDVNDFFYIEFFYPISRFYKKELNKDIREGIDNFFFNLNTPVRLINKVLQGKIQASGEELLSFSLNSTLGVAGIFNVSEKYLDIILLQEDFGQTLGTWGVPSGPHIVLPLLGPSNLRDIAGLSFDYQLDPVNEFEYSSNYYKQTFVKSSLSSLRKVNETSLQTLEYEDLKEGNFNLYIFLKESYEEIRIQEINK